MTRKERKMGGDPRLVNKLHLVTSPSNRPQFNQHFLISKQLSGRRARGGNGKMGRTGNANRKGEKSLARQPSALR